MLVSIVMPTYNCARYISMAIESVLNQTISDWELYVVDDCSTDTTEEIVCNYARKNTNIHYVKLREKSGAAVARTKAIELATGKYVAFLDSDDLWDERKLERQIDFMQENNILMSATSYRHISSEGKKLGKIFIPPNKMNYRDCLRHSDPIGNLTVVYNQEHLGKFQVPNIAKRNDFALWLQILKKVDFCYGLDEVLASYRVARDGSIGKHNIALAKYHWELYHSVEGHGILRSVYEMLCWVMSKGLGIGVRRRKENIL